MLVVAQRCCGWRRASGPLGPRRLRCVVMGIRSRAGWLGAGWLCGVGPQANTATLGQQQGSSRAARRQAGRHGQRLPSCGRSFLPEAHGHSHGTRRHGTRLHQVLPAAAAARRLGPRLAAAAAAAGVLPAAAAVAHVATPRVSLPPIHRTPSCASLCLGRGCSLLIAHCSSHTAQRSLPYIPPSRRTLLPPAPRPIWPLARPIPPQWGPPTPGPPPSRPLLSQRPRAGAALIAYIVRLSLLF